MKSVSPGRNAQKDPKTPEIELEISVAQKKYVFYKLADFLPTERGFAR